MAAFAASKYFSAVPTYLNLSSIASMLYTPIFPYTIGFHAGDIAQLFFFSHRLYYKFFFIVCHVCTPKIYSFLFPRIAVFNHHSHLPPALRLSHASFPIQRELQTRKPASAPSCGSCSRQKIPRYSPRTQRRWATAIAARFRHPGFVGAT